MELINQNNNEISDYRIIIGSNDFFPGNITKEDKNLFSSFLKTEEDFTIITSLNSSVFLVKHSEDREKMRVRGAKIREGLKHDVSEIQIFAKEEVSADLIEGLLLSNYQFLKYFSKKEKKRFTLAKIYIDKDFGKDKMRELLDIKNAVYWARDMVNEPVSFLNAEQFSKEIDSFSKSAGMEVTILEKSQIEALKMGGLLAVNKGSIDPPTFSIVEYKGKNASNKKPIVLVGKGVVYDTGGLSLKPTPNSMDLMKSDMGGAATMIGAIYLAAIRKLPLHIIALIPATDNRPGLNAYAPGDIITMYNGTTVEVLNTDAEGRMILADALSYSNKYKPELVIDAATLTGAAQRAVGEHATVVMGNAKEKYFDQLEKAANESYERVVRFPFWEEYGEEMKSSIADLKNLGGPSAGMITAGKFLEHFVEAEYIHMDIAGSAWLDKNSGYRTKGGSGVGVRMLYQFLKNYA